jgi:hypothetical protein
MADTLEDYREIFSFLREADAEEISILTGLVASMLAKRSPRRAWTVKQDRAKTLTIGKQNKTE